MVPKKLLAMLALPLILASCLQAELDVVLGDNGMVRMDIRYTVSEALLLSGAPEAAPEFWLLPLGREDFQRMVDFTPGLELRRYRQRHRGEQVTVWARLVADSVESANAILAPGSGAGIRQASGASGTNASLVVMQPLPGPGASVLSGAEGADQVTLRVSFTSGAGRSEQSFRLPELLSLRLPLVLDPASPEPQAP